MKSEKITRFANRTNRTLCDDRRHPRAHIVRERQHGGRRRPRHVAKGVHHRRHLGGQRGVGDVATAHKRRQRTQSGGSGEIRRVTHADGGGGGRSGSDRQMSASGMRVEDASFGLEKRAMFTRPRSEK